MTVGECIAASAIEPSLTLDDEDYSARFVDGRWVVKWKWTEGGEPKLKNAVAQYKVDSAVSQAFNDEVDEWIRLGWLLPYEGGYDGILPLMAVVQLNKSKVRPVMDYRELNESVSSHTAESDVCGEKLRKWRKMGTNLSIVDLRKAYLQLHVDESLWRYQVVKYKGRLYCLTRLGFGLSAAPRIMTAVLRKVLSEDPEVAAGTDSYIDDIIVNEDVVSSERVRQHLARFGLDAKESEPLDGGRVLGLRVANRDGVMMWKRDNVLTPLESNPTRRQVFSYCGRLIGHFPVASWLRPACSFIKRATNGIGWSDCVGDSVERMLREVADRIAVADPVGSVWAVPNSSAGTVWCDASSIATGVVVEVDGDVVEDASWRRKKDDAAHINLAELESMIKGINMAAAWGLSRIDLRTDSSTVYGWLRCLLSRERRIKTRGLGEALARRRLQLIASLIEECELTVEVTLVRSAENKADVLTRVPQKWLHGEMCCVAENRANQECIRQEHVRHHFGVDRTLYFARRRYPDRSLTREQVREVVASCVRCSSIDPAPVRWQRGHLDVKDHWSRVASDVTHYNGSHYVTFIDCGPSKFTVWKPVPDQSAEEITRCTESLFREHGAPLELLLDNGASFRSRVFRSMCAKWGVRIEYRCAYRASGNGVVERIHRTVKRMAARTGSDVLDMAYWYNVSPKVGVSDATVPSTELFRYRWRCPGVDPEAQRGLERDHAYRVGQRVFVKPDGARCTQQWVAGTVTNVGRGVQVEVNGVPRHIADIRAAAVQEIENRDNGVDLAEVDWSATDSDNESGSDDTLPAVELPAPRRNPRRASRLPNRLTGFVLGDEDST